MQASSEVHIAKECFVHHGDQAANFASSTFRGAEYGPRLKMPTSTDVQFRSGLCAPLRASSFSALGKFRVFRHADVHPCRDGKKYIGFWKDHVLIQSYHTTH